MKARGCHLRWTTRCWCELCYAMQRVSKRGGKAHVIAVGVLGGGPQAQLDGFKSRPLNSKQYPAGERR
eukprot:6244131-Prymnesium_polylepis.1